MNSLTIPAIVLCAVGLIALIWALFKTGRPFVALLRTCALGLCCLMCVNLLSSLTGVSLPINAVSLASSSLLGMPGVAAMLICGAVMA